MVGDQTRSIRSMRWAISSRNFVRRSGLDESTTMNSGPSVAAIAAWLFPAAAIFPPLSRNWWWKLLSGNELQIERLSLFFKPFDALEPELFFVMFDTLFDIVLSVTQHAID